MKYEVTCGNCGKRYRIDAIGGQTINSVCPNCGHKITVCLPYVNIGNASEKSAKPSNKHNAVFIAFAIILGVSVGAVAWWTYQHKLITDEQERRASKAAYKAHIDSLMQLRNQQEAEEESERQAVAEQKATATFLLNFYNDWFIPVWLASKSNPTEYANNLSQQCYEKLIQSDENNNKHINWDMLGPHFRISTEDATDLNKLSRNLVVTHDHDSWYRIRFTAHGVTEFRHIEVFVYKSRIIINDFY